MCGIVAILNPKEETKSLRAKAIKLAKTVRHRGPDWSGLYINDNAILAHERLAIVGVDSGAQPLKAVDCVLAVNGEIYNHTELRHTKLNHMYEFKTHSDCEVILYLYKEYGVDFLNDLNGIFAFVLHDEKTGDNLIARDPIGVIPLYYGYDKAGNLYVASEMKALIDCEEVHEFPPGSYMHKGIIKKYYQPDWSKNQPQIPCDYSALANSLSAAVKRQLMCDVPFGLLISGGVDSSIIAALAAKYARTRVESYGEKAWWPQLHSFSVGLEGAPDFHYAKIVADAIGSIHHEVHFTLQEGIDALSDVIYHTETFDTTTIRASTPMFIMARKIKSYGIKMVLSGEGADEIFGGYLYFHKAPNPAEFYQETVRKISKLHLYDCLRANKSMASWGVEARVPFLDLEFIEYAMNIRPEDKMIINGKMEKQILRDSFKGLIPEAVLFRQKEQFSDGVGYSWIDGIKKIAEQEISDKQMSEAKNKFPIKTPRTKEDYLYRELWAQHFPEQCLDCVAYEPSIACSTPTALKWDKSFENQADPSGRAVANVHEKSIKVLNGVQVKE
ncbi:MAG: asparagine synthase B [Bdellovibrionota bacterium]